MDETPPQEWTVVSIGADCGALTHHTAPRFRVFWDEGSDIFRGIDLDRIKVQGRGSMVPVPGRIPATGNGEKELRFFAYTWTDSPMFGFFQPAWLDGLMQRAAVAVRSRSRQLTARKFTVLDMLTGFGLVAHHEYPRMTAWWQRAVCGRLIGPEQASPAAVRDLTDDPADPLELFEAHWQDPRPATAHCQHLMQQAAAAVEDALAEQVQQIAQLYGDPLDKAAS